ncbi:MAG: amidohydrolase, partial [Myxococcota bacterium]|nr:amidohydrolase [Myxococcota bacterium]
MRAFQVVLALASLTACATHAPAVTSSSSPPLVLPAAAPPPSPVSSAEGVQSVRSRADGWRLAHRIVDLHMHVDATPEHLAQAVRIMDTAGIGVAVNLSGGTVTRANGRPSDLAATKALADERFPGRFVEYMNLDYADWDKPDFAQRAVAQVDEGAREGAAGFKEFKRLGLFLRDARRQLIKIDDPKLDPMWRRLGELGMPVSIHVADPKAFWGPYDATNERWHELKDHPRWWFGDPKQYPRREELLAALERVIGRHPETTFVCVHFANNAE